MNSIIIGCGKYGEVYFAYLRESGVNIVGFLDDDPQYEGTTICGVPVLGKIADLPRLKDEYDVRSVYCPLGNNKLRVKFLDFARGLGLETPNYIHPTVVIAPEVEIADQGVYILQSTQIMPFVKIDKDVMISIGANIIHHTHLEQGVFVSNGVNLGASLVAKKYAYCGMGCTIMTGVHSLGEACLIGAGAVVIRDVPDGAVMAGVPAKVIKYKMQNTMIQEDKHIMGGGNPLIFNLLQRPLAERSGYAA